MIHHLDKMHNSTKYYQNISSMKDIWRAQVHAREKTHTCTCSKGKQPFLHVTQHFDLVRCTTLSNIIINLSIEGIKESLKKVK